MPKDFPVITNISGGGWYIDLREIRKVVEILNALSIPITVKELLDVVAANKEFTLKSGLQGLNRNKV